MNGRTPPASLQQQQRRQRVLDSLAANSIPRTTVAVADKADDASSSSSADGTPLSLLQHLQEVESPAPMLPNGGAAPVGGSAVAGVSSAGDTCSDESVDGSRVAAVEPTVAAVADEVGVQPKSSVSSKAATRFALSSLQHLRTAGCCTQVLCCHLRTAGFLCFCWHQVLPASSPPGFSPQHPPHQRCACCFCCCRADRCAAGPGCRAARPPRGQAGHSTAQRSSAHRRAARLL